MKGFASSRSISNSQKKKASSLTKSDNKLLLKAIHFQREGKFKDAKTKASDDPFMRDIDSLIYCHNTIHIKVPKPSFMKNMGKNKTFNPQT